MPVRLLIVFVIGMMLAGCATNRHDKDAANVNSSTTRDSAGEVAPTDADATDEANDEDEYDEEEFSDNDPFEGFNRWVYAFNNQADRFVLRPVAQQYAKLPVFVRNRVGSFLSNLNEPTNVANDLLQGKWLQAAEDTTRFVVNSTAGILGLFDVATHVDLPKHDEDFGQTLAVWGIGEGPYLMLPLLGPSNVRDAVGLVPEYLYTDPITHINDSGTRLAVRATQFADTRARLLRADKLLNMQLDPYIFLRESYRQKREQLIENGDADN